MFFKFFTHIMLILFLLILHKSTKLQKTRNVVWLILFDSEKHAKKQKLRHQMCFWQKLLEMTGRKQCFRYQSSVLSSIGLLIIFHCVLLTGKKTCNNHPYHLVAKVYFCTKCLVCFYQTFKWKHALPFNRVPTQFCI